MVATRTAEPEAYDFEALVAECQGPVMRYLLARTRSSVETAELLQETFVRAYCALAKGDSPRRPLPWLLAIARNVFVEMVRTNRHRREMTERLALRMGPGAEILWDEHVEQRIIVSNAVDVLPNDLREPVLLHYFAGLPLPEVATQLEITPGALRTRLWRARRALRGELEGIMGEVSKVRFTLPRNLAEKAQQIAENPPLYEELYVTLQVGGRRWPTSPVAKPVLDGSALSYSDVEFAIERIHAARLAGDRPLCQKLDFYPGLEFFEHPRAVDLYMLTRSAGIGIEAFLADEGSRIAVTDGWYLGTHPDARQLLRDFFATGELKWIWYTVAGYGATHDEICERPGAFDAIVNAMQGKEGIGIGMNWQIILSKRSAPEVGKLAEIVTRTRKIGAHLPVYTESYSDAPLYESLRPEPEDLIANGLPQKEGFVWHIAEGLWTEPERFTEAHWVQEALANPQAGPTIEERQRKPLVWVTPGLELWVNDDRPRLKLANLRTDSPAQVYQAIANVPWPPAPPTDQELAQRYGDATSRKLYTNLKQVRGKWLEAWRVEQGVPWLPWTWTRPQ